MGSVFTSDKLMGGTVVRGIAVVAAALISGTAQTAPFHPVRLKTFGFASNSCASIAADSGIQRQADMLYIAGVWDGINMMENVNVGWSTDQAGMMGEVMLECQKRPSDILINAIYQARKRMKASSR